MSFIGRNNKNASMAISFAINYDSVFFCITLPQRKIIAQWVIVPFIAGRNTW
jgi:hypothetical protein